MSVYIVPRGAMTWFLKLDGQTAQVDAQRAAFDQFIASVGDSRGDSMTRSLPAPEIAP